MHLFLFLALPSAALAYCFAFAQKPSRFFPPAAIGATMGAILCVIKEFFIFSPPPRQVIFSSHVIWAVCEFSLPVLLMAFLWQLFSKSDGDFKTQALFPLLSFLCASLVVREAFATGEETSAFMLFLHPALAVCTLLFFCSCVALCKTQAHHRNIALCFLFLCFAAVSVCIAPVLQALWKFKIAESLYLYASAGFALLSVVLFSSQRKVFAQHETGDELPSDESLPQKQQEPVTKQMPVEPPIEGSPWGWDMKSQKEDAPASKGRADDEARRENNSWQKSTLTAEKPASARQGRMRGTASSPKRGGSRRGRLGKNIYRRRRKR